MTEQLLRNAVKEAQEKKQIGFVPAEILKQWFK